jgi:hypothetical protein
VAVDKGEFVARRERKARGLEIRQVAQLPGGSMKFHVKIAGAAAAVVIGALPALAIAAGPGNSANAPGHNKTASTGTTVTGAPPSGDAAFGRLCQKESKRHVAGQKGTPFSQCVTALAKVADGSTTNPAKACAKESKHHVAGQKGTPFSQCVKAAAKLEAEEHKDTSTTTGTSSS